MREIAEMFVPKSMYAAVPVRMLPPVRTLTGLAGWGATAGFGLFWICLLYTSPSPRDLSTSRMPSSA